MALQGRGCRGMHLVLVLALTLRGRELLEDRDKWGSRVHPQRVTHILVFNKYLLNLPGMDPFLELFITEISTQQQKEQEQKGALYPPSA